MKRAILFSTAFAVLICLSGLPLMAQGRGGGMAGGPGMGQNGAMSQGQRDRQAMQRGMEQSGMNQPSNNRVNQSSDHRKTPSQLLQKNTELTARLKNLLPADEKVQDAATGFKNLGEFVAAVHVAHNLNIPFNQFKAKVTSGDNLGKAVHALNPKLSHKEIKAQVKKGKREAKQDIKASHHRA